MAKLCAHCGGPIVKDDGGRVGYSRYHGGKRHDARFCSDKCRTDAWREARRPVKVSRERLRLLEAIVSAWREIRSTDELVKLAEYPSRPHPWELALHERVTAAGGSYVPRPLAFTDLMADLVSNLREDK